MSDFNDTIIGETNSRHGKKRYHYINNNPNTIFDKKEEDVKKIDYSFLSPETIGKELKEQQLKKNEYKDHYLINLNDKQMELMNTLIAESDDPEEEMYKLATIVKYADNFNLPLNFVSENLEDINKYWIGTGATPYKSNFKAVADSFLIGVNTLNLSKLGNQLMLAEKRGDQKEIKDILKQLKEAEDRNTELQDKMPRKWIVELLKAGANTIPFSSSVLLPSLAASFVNPIIGGAVGFGRSASIQNGLEYWELRKAGVNKDLAENLAILSSGLQATVETALGNIAGILGRGLKVDTITSKVLKKLTAQRTIPMMAKILMQYGGEAFEEGIEESIQELISAGTKETAAALQGEGVETDDAWTIAGNVWESFKGGIAGSVVLGIPGAGINTKQQFSEAKNLKKAAIVNPSKEDFINKHKDDSIFDGMTEDDKRENLSNYYDNQKQTLESFQKMQDKKEYLSDTARIEGEAMRDDEGNIIYKTDENGNFIYERDKDGNLQKIPKRYGAPKEVVRLANGRLYIQEGKVRQRNGGIVEGEYIVGDPTQETNYNDYAHLHYTYNEDKNTVRIDEVVTENDIYTGIVKEFIRDFGEDFKGVKIEWDAKGETLQKIKDELIAENPNGKENGLQYFTENTDRTTIDQRIKFDEQLKKVKPDMTAEQRQMGYELVKSFAETNFKESADEYIAKTFAENFFTDEKFENMDEAAAQQGVDPSDVKGATTWKNIDGYARAVIYLSKKSDFSTLAHELGHVFLETLPEELKTKAAAALDVQNGQWTAKDKDNFCYSLERYYVDGKAPTPELQTLFEKAADFILRVYKAIENMFVTEISPEIKEVFDEMLGKKESGIYQAETRFNEAEQIKQSKKNTTGKYPSVEDYENNKISETEEDKALDDTALKEKYKAYAKEHFQGNTYHNADTNLDIRVSRDIIGEWKAKTKSREQIISMQLLDKMIETAVETNATKDKYNKEYTTSIKYFETGLTVNDKTYKAHLTVKEIQETDNKAYHYYLEDVSFENIFVDQIKKEAALSPLAPLNERGNQPLLHGSDNSIPQNAEAVNTEKTEKGKINEAYEKATQAAREAMQNSIKAAEERKEDIRLNGAQYEAETIEYYKKHHPDLDDEAIKTKIQEEAKRLHTSYEEFNRNRALEQRRLNEMGGVFFQVEPVTQEEIAFKENADEYRKGIDKHFTGKLPASEVLTVTKRTPAILRAVGFDDKPITVTGATLKHITDKHKDITQAILKSLPEQLLDPIAVFKSQKQDKPNSRLIFTEHFVNGKPVIVAIEMNYKDKHIEMNSIRSVYERDVYSKKGLNILQENFIDAGLLQYIDDKRADEWSAITGVSFPLEAFSNLNPSNNIIGENNGNVNTIDDKRANEWLTSTGLLMPLTHKPNLSPSSNIIGENNGNVNNIDDKRADEWSAITGVRFPLEAFSNLNPSNNIIGENRGNVNTGVLKKSDIIGDNAEAIYFQVEKELYEEVANAESREEVKENLENIIIGKDVKGAENLIYYSEEEQKQFDAIYNTEKELKKITEDKLKDIKTKDATFFKMLSQDREALRSFMKQYIKATETDSHLQKEINENGTRFLGQAILITKMRHPLNAKQFNIALNMIKEDTAFFRNIFAEINGYEALRSITTREAAFINAFADSVFEGKKTNTKSRSEIQDEMFLDEIADDTKFDEFLNESARIYFFDFDNFKAADEEDAAYRDEMKRKQDRIYHEMRNFSWKGTLAKIKAGEKPSEKSIKNIKAQIKNAARSYRSLYSDIMERADMRVKDAETTDAIIKTKLKSRPRKTAEITDYMLYNMSNAEKGRLLRALENEELEERARLGILTGDDIEKIRGLIKEKNENIKDLEKELEKLKEENADDTQMIFRLKKQIKNERINRKVLADTVKARDVAAKAIMKRISLDSCSADIAESLAAVQWFLKPEFQKMLKAEFNLVDVRAAEAYRLWKADSKFRKDTYNKQKRNKSWPAIQNILNEKTPETWTSDDIRLLSRLVPNTEEYNIRESYALWGTSQEFRNTLERLVGHKKDWYALRNLLENKNIRDWTGEDKKLASRMLPPRSKYFSLGIYAKTEKNFLDMRTADLAPEKRVEAISSVLPSEMIAKLKHQPLSQWTVDEMLDLAKIITEKHSEGKSKYLSWKATQNEEAAFTRNAGIKSFKSLKDYQEKAAAWSQDEKDKKGGFSSLRRKLKYVAMRSYAFIEMLDGGKRGTLYALLEYEQRECNNVYRQSMDKRLEKFQEFMQENKIDIASLDKKHVFENFYKGRDKKNLTLTTQELIGVYMASLDERSRDALRYGNLAEPDEREVAELANDYNLLDEITGERLSKVLKAAKDLISNDKAMKNLVEYLQAEYKSEGLKLYEHNKRVNNTITEIRDHYFPMLRLDVLGEENVNTTEQKVKGEYAPGSQNSIANGQSKARIFIGKAHQTAIQLGAVSTYLQSIEANERLYAYDVYAQKLNRIFKGYNSKPFRDTLRTAYGDEAVTYLDKQISTIIDPNSGRVFSSTDKLLRVLRGSTAVSSLSWKMSGIIKQGITSPAPFMQYVNPAAYVKAAIDLARNNKEMMEFIYSRSSLMKHRSFDMMQNITEELAKNAKTKAGKALTFVQQQGMKGLEMIDMACVAPGWLAAFRLEKARLEKANKTLEKPLTDLEIDLQATQWADDVLVRTQPSGRAEELAPLFREGGEALRMLLQFQSSLNVIYNNIRHDLPNAIKNKQYWRAVGIITGYTLAGIAVGALTEGFGDDDDDTSDKVRKGVYYAFTQYTDSVPIISGIVDSVAEKVITGKTSYKGRSSLYATVEKAAQGAIALTDGDFKKAAGKYAEATALTLGLPSSGTKEAFYAIDQMINGELPSALVGRRK